MKTLLIATFLLPNAWLADEPINARHFPLPANEPIHASHPATGSECRNAQTKQTAPYLFHGFVKGTVYFRNGTRQDALVNYHRHDGQMQFLDSRSDTLLFTNKFLIDFIETSGRRFILTDENSDMEVVGSAGKVVLAARTRPEMAGNNLSHSGQHFSASEGNVGRAAMVTSQGGQFQWENNASGQQWKVKTTYFLIDQNRIVHPASRRTFLRVFGRNRRHLVRYIHDNRICFHDANDLQNLMKFCDHVTGL